MLLNHTGCGFTTFTDDEMNAKLSGLTGDASPAPMRFFSYKHPEQNTREQIKKVRSHPWIAKEVPVRSFIFDVETGLILGIRLHGTPLPDGRWPSEIDSARRRVPGATFFVIPVRRARTGRQEVLDPRRRRQ